MGNNYSTALIYLNVKEYGVDVYVNDPILFSGGARFVRRELSNIPSYDKRHLTISQRPLERLPVTQIKFDYLLLNVYIPVKIICLR